MATPEKPIDRPIHVNDPLRARVLRENLHKAPSVGSLVPKILAINPELTSQQVIELVRVCMTRRGSDAGDFADVEVLDEQKALRLAKESLIKENFREKPKEQ